VAAALETLGLPALIKWPNDVLVNRKKLCGILAEAVWSGSELRGLVLGIGVNVAPESVPPPEEVMFPATCIQWELGRPVERLGLLREVLAHLLVWREQIGQPKFLKAWRDHLAFRNEMVEVHPPGKAAVHGRLVGVGKDGSLQLDLPGGEEMSFAAGDVHLRPDSGKER
jgi:BirA family biotin operon repressor/biotin-[acetyl-CoA-carboxylase] ligase